MNKYTVAQAIDWLKKKAPLLASSNRIYKDLNSEKLCCEYSPGIKRKFARVLIPENCLVKYVKQFSKQKGK